MWSSSLLTSSPCPFNIFLVCVSFNCLLWLSLDHFRWQISSFSLSSDWPLCLFLTPSSNRLTFLLTVPWLTFCIYGKANIPISGPFYRHAHTHMHTDGQPTTIHTLTHIHIELTLYIVPHLPPTLIFVIYFINYEPKTKI